MPRGFPQKPVSHYGETSHLWNNPQDSRKRVLDSLARKGAKTESIQRNLPKMHILLERDAQGCAGNKMVAYTMNQEIQITSASIHLAY